MDFSDIEKAVIDSLKTTGLTEFNVRDYGVRNEKSTLVAPAVYCSIESGAAAMVGADARWTLALFVVVVFHNARGEAARREGIYPIITGVIQYLTGKDLGLEIEGLEPVSMRNITDREDAASGLTVFSIQFKTAAVIEAADEEQDAVDLISLGVRYFLNPGSDTAQASDEIDLS